MSFTILELFLLRQQVKLSLSGVIVLVTWRVAKGQSAL